MSNGNPNNPQEKDPNEELINLGTDLLKAIKGNIQELNASSGTYKTATTTLIQALNANFSKKTSNTKTVAAPAPKSANLTTQITSAIKSGFATVGNLILGTASAAPRRQALPSGGGGGGGGGGGVIGGGGAPASVTTPSPNTSAAQQMLQNIMSSTGGGAAAGLGYWALLSIIRMDKTLTYPIQKGAGYAKDYFKEEYDKIRGQYKQITNQTLEDTATDQLTRGNELYKERIKFLKKVEEMKTSIAVDDSALGISFKQVHKFLEDAPQRFDDINGELFKLFGGADTYHQRVQKNIGSLGVYQDLFSRSMTKNLEVIKHFERGRQALMLADGDVEVLMRISAAKNQHWSKTFDTVRKATQAASDKYGINVGLIRKDTNLLRKDFTNFGHLGEEAIGDLVGKMRTLGVEAKDLAGIMGKFNTFDTAAKSASELNQAFGMNLDAMKLIKAESPAEIFEMMRESLLRTGRTFDDLTFREKKYLASKSGIKAEHWKSLGQFDDPFATFEDKQEKFSSESGKMSAELKSQINAMKNLTGAIKNIYSTKDFKSAEAAAKDAAKAQIRRQKDLREEAINTAKAVEKVYLDISGSGSAGEKETKKIHDAFSNILHVMKEINEVRFGENMIRQWRSVVKAIGQSGVTYNQDLKKKDAKEYKKQKDLSKIYIAEAADDVTKFVVQARVAAKKFRYKVYGLAIRALTPAFNGILESIQEELAEISDPSGRIDFSKLLKKMDVDYGFAQEQFKELLLNLQKLGTFAIKQILPLVSLHINIIGKAIYELIKKITGGSITIPGLPPIPMPTWEQIKTKLRGLGIPIAYNPSNRMGKPRFRRGYEDEFYHDNNSGRFELASNNQNVNKHFVSGLIKTVKFQSDQIKALKTDLTIASVKSRSDTESSKAQKNTEITEDKGLKVILPINIYNADNQIIDAYEITRMVNFTNKNQDAFTGNEAERIENITLFNIPQEV